MCRHASVPGRGGGSAVGQSPPESLFVCLAAAGSVLKCKGFAYVAYAKREGARKALNEFEANPAAFTLFGKQVLPLAQRVLRVFILSMFYC